MKSLADSQLRDLSLVNAVYGEAFGSRNLLPDDYATLAAGLYMKENGCRYLATEGAYQNMIVLGLFGGKLLFQRTEAEETLLLRFENQRTRLIVQEQLIAGDVIVADTNLKCTVQALYLYTGEALLDLSSNEVLSQEESIKILTECISYSQFAVLRPSLGMDNK